MAWYKAGTAGVTNGSATVTGAGTLWVSGARIGHQWIGPDGLSYEITNIVSDTQLTVDPPYRGATAGGQSYRIAPTQDEVATAGRVMAELIGTFAIVRDTIGRGLVSAGSLAAPDLRFAADQDTGVRRIGDNLAALTAGGVDAFAWSPSGVAVGSFTPLARLHVGSGGNANMPAALFYQNNGGGSVQAQNGLAIYNNLSGGLLDSVIAYGASPNSYLAIGHHNGSAYAERVRVDPSGNLGVGTAAPLTRLHIGQSGACELRVSSGTHAAKLIVGDGGFASFGTISAAPLVMVTGDTERARLDMNGNALFGVASGAQHTFAKGSVENSLILGVQAVNGPINCYIAAANKVAWSTAAAALYIGANTSTNRSINAAGTINASGADYAEYMKKAGVCGVLAKGQIVGVDAKGLLTDRHSLAHSFVIKSTDPAYVGGDNWSPGPPPAEPILALPAYTGPAEPSAPGGAPAELPFLADRPEEPVREAGEEDLAFIRRMAAWIVRDATWVKAMDARPAEVEAQALAATAHVEAEARFKADLTAWQKATAAHAVEVAAAEKKHAAAVAQYRTDKTAWDAKMEAARQCVDRVAFSGQVPCNVAAGTFHPGDYIIGAKGKNDEIVGLVVTNAAMRLTPGQRCDAVGKVWRIMEDGRAWVAVLIG